MRDYKLKFSHLGIMVTDLDKMIDFYSRVLGFPVTDRGMLHGTIPIAFLSRDPGEHHQIALIQGRPASLTETTINQISFRLPDLDALKRLREALIAEGFDKHRCVTHGNAWALYVHDPEGNQIELFVDSKWYIEQPCSLPVDLTQPTDVILRASEEFCKTQPGFKPIEEWRADMAKLIEKHDRA